MAWSYDHNAVNNAAIASSKQWLLPNIAHAIWKTILSNLNYVQCLNIAPKKKALWHLWNISSSLIALIKKAWFYERFFFGMVMVMLKDKKNITAFLLKLTF